MRYFSCSTKTSHVFPKRGKNKRGEYKFIVADPNTDLVQVVRVSLNVNIVQ